LRGSANIGSAAELYSILGSAAGTHGSKGRGLWQPARNLAQPTNKQNKQTNQQTKKQTNKQTHIQFNLEDWYTQPFDPGFFRLPSMPPAAMFLSQPRTDLVPGSPDILQCKASLTGLSCALLQHSEPTQRGCLCQPWAEAAKEVRDAHEHA
jgi:hypothetical protein